MDSYLRLLVVAKAKELGDERAAEFFGVSRGLIRQWVAGSKPPSLAAVEKVFVPPDTKPEEAAWADKEVFLAAPFYRTTNPRTMFAVLALWDRPKYGFRYRFGDAFIAHARNQLAEDFKTSGLPVCQWIDDDMIPPIGLAGWFFEHAKMPCPAAFAARHGINRLRSHGKTLIGGLYYGRWEHGKAMYAEANTDPAEDAKSRQYLDQIQPTAWVGTGFLQHTREVLLDIEKAFPHLQPRSPTDHWGYFSNTADRLVERFSGIQILADNAAKELVSSAEAAGQTLSELAKLIRTSQEEFSRLDWVTRGEDQTFCARALKAGHQPYVDLGCICGHVDGSVVYGPHNTGK